MRKLLLLGLLTSLVAAGCGSSSDTTTTTTGQTTTTAGVTTTSGGITSTTAADATTTSAVAGGPDCVVGTWVFQSEAFIEAMRQLIAAEGESGEVSDTGGTYTVEMAADGTFTAERDEWGFSIATSDGTVVISVSGTDTGTWSATGDTITVETVSSNAEVSVTVETGGQVITLTDSPVDFPEGITAESAPYSCGGDTLTVTTEEYTAVLERV